MPVPKEVMKVAIHVGAPMIIVGPEAPNVVPAVHNCHENVAASKMSTVTVYTDREQCLFIIMLPQPWMAAWTLMKLVVVLLAPNLPEQSVPYMMTTVEWWVSLLGYLMQPLLGSVPTLTGPNLRSRHGQHRALPARKP